MLIYLRRLSQERGATLAEYALIVALIALVAIPSISYLRSSVTGSLNEAGTELASASSASNATGDQGSAGATSTTTAPSSGGGSSGGTSGSGGGGGTTPTTTAPATTTTTMPPTTTTSTTSTTTTTMPPTTTTTVAPQPPPQSETVTYNNEIAATFEAADDTITLDGVSADGWTYRITKDTGTILKVKFTSSDGATVILFKAWLDRDDGALKTKVRELT